MRTHVVVVSTVAAALLWAVAARAQDEPKVGVTMGYPSAIGILWKAADRIALRPEATLAKGSSESSSSNPIIGAAATSAPSDNWQLGVGLSALFYVSRTDGLRTYVTPRFAYSKTSTSANLAGSPVSSTSDSRAYTTSGSFGAEYGLGRHFGVFGEVGVSYTTATSETSTIETITSAISIVPGVFTVRSETHTHTVGARSGAGVIFFF
jgi:hypothetical protein